MAGCDERVGPRGPMGLQGAKGDTGAAGSMGIQGPQGPQGLQGMIGNTGFTGAKGEKGVDGLQGDRGPAGTPGIDGLQGIPGPAGSPGATGAAGRDGTPGAQGPRGATGAQGPTGANGTNGRYILGAYNSLTGIGNSAAIGDETLAFSQNLIGNLLSNDGDEIELFVNTEYFANDIVNLIFSIDSLNRYTYVYQNPDNDVRFIKIKIARIDKVNQLWTIEDVTKTLLGPVLNIMTIDTFATTFDLASPMTFEILIDNTVIGIDQVVLKKAVMYLNKLV